MKNPRLMIYASLTTIIVCLYFGFKVAKKTSAWFSPKIKTTESITADFAEKKQISLDNDLAKLSLRIDQFELAVLVFKKEKTVEIYLRENHQNPWLYYKKYLFKNFSGNIGPKLKNGDKQIPEGVYDMEYLNPNSKYHLSIKVSYPNEFDQKMAKNDGRTDLGGDIMIHGKNATIGCIPIGDEAIEELFFLAAKAKNREFPIIIAPHDFREDKNYPKIEGINWEEELYSHIEKSLTPFQK